MASWQRLRSAPVPPLGEPYSYRRLGTPKARAASNVEHRPLYADTSTECALRLARACARGEYAELAGATVLNNHFDTDGVLAVWACLKPAEALRHSALL